ncbi:MAG: hypothetical protein QNK23_04245 [Crocinitomicaceae bacterium]|nr:hypothetical protein [Crocinitomicaceae bacterium]
MKKLLTIAVLLVSFCSFADQLAYISKADAERAVEFISKKKKIYLFCGCCSIVEPKLVKVIEVSAKFTNYENYYEVYIKYKNENGEIVEEPIDLAYVWFKKKKEYFTVGSKLGPDHDPCVELDDWDNPKHIEEDI